MIKKNLKFSCDVNSLEGPFKSVFYLNQKQKENKQWADYKDPDSLGEKKKGERKEKYIECGECFLGHLCEEITKPTLKYQQERTLESFT